jgi:hypothetical protein
MITQSLKSPAGPTTFRSLARLMQRNIVRQCEFAILLRILSSQFAARSVENQRLRIAAHTARNKGAKLRDLLNDIGWAPTKPKHRHPVFLIWFHLAKSCPPHLMIPFLTLAVERRVRARLLDTFCPWDSAHRDEVKLSRQSTPVPTLSIPGRVDGRAPRQQIAAAHVFSIRLQRNARFMIPTSECSRQVPAVGGPRSAQETDQPPER